MWPHFSLCSTLEFGNSTYQDILGNTDQEVISGYSVAGGNEQYSVKYPVYTVVNKPKKQASFNKGERITATAL